MDSREILTGDNVVLRRPRKEDAPFFARWYNEEEVRFRCAFPGPTTLEEEEAVVARHLAAEDYDWFTVTDKDGKILGETGLLRLFPAWGCTDLSIILPDPATHRQGCGTEVMGLMLRRAFLHHGLNRVALEAVEGNAPALAFYEAMGFRREGVAEQGYYYGGRYLNFVMLRILRSEWAARQKLPTGGLR